MTDLIFYHVPDSTSNVTLAVLAELNVRHELVELSIDAGETREKDFLIRNPNGRVPLVLHAGIPIWESAAITMYLGEVFGVERGLYPSLGPKRGQAMMWIVWANVVLAEAAGRLSGSLPEGSPGAVLPSSRDWKAAEARSSGARSAATGDLARCFGVLNDAVDERPFLLDTYSLADTHLWSFIGWVSSMDFDVTHYPAVDAWRRRCGERPALSRL